MKRDLRMPELIPTDMRVSEFFLNFPLLNIEHVRTVLDRKLLRSGVEGEDILDGGSIGGLIRAKVMKTTQMGYRFYSPRENQHESTQIMSICFIREARGGDVRILSC